MEEEKDFYIQDGYRVLTESFLVRRGFCCGNGCKHCPYFPKHEKGSVEVMEDVKKRLTNKG